MTHGFRLHIWGEYACFTRPELKVERASYEVITPSAARGVLEAIYWNPSISWTVDRIHILRPIRFRPFRRHEVKSKVSTQLARLAMKRGDVGGLGLDITRDRQQRAALILADVAYVLEAHFKIREGSRPQEAPAKHAAMFERRARKGQCYHRPYLGSREFPAGFRLLAPDEPMPASSLPIEQRDRDLGLMFFGMDFGHDGAADRAIFFPAHLRGGVLDMTGQGQGGGA